MSDKITNDILIIDALLRIKVLEEIIVEKKLITKEELKLLVNAYAQQIQDDLLKKNT